MRRKSKLSLLLGITILLMGCKENFTEEMAIGGSLADSYMYNTYWVGQSIRIGSDSMVKTLCIEIKDSKIKQKTGVGCVYASEFYDSLVAKTGEFPYSEIEVNFSKASGTEVVKFSNEQLKLLKCAKEMSNEFLLQLKSKNVNGLLKLVQESLREKNKQDFEKLVNLYDSLTNIKGKSEYNFLSYCSYCDSCEEKLVTKIEEVRPTINSNHIITLRFATVDGHLLLVGFYI